MLQPHATRGKHAPTSEGAAVQKGLDGSFHEKDHCFRAQATTGVMIKLPLFQTGTPAAGICFSMTCGPCYIQVIPTLKIYLIQSITRLLPGAPAPAHAKGVKKKIGKQSSVQAGPSCPCSKKPTTNNQQVAMRHYTVLYYAIVYYNIL